MELPVQITIRDLPRSEALAAHIRRKAAKLAALHDRIVSCRIVVEQLALHQQQGRRFRVSIDLRVPGRQIVANRDHHEDAYAAVREALDAAKRQLEETLRARRVVKPHARVHEHEEAAAPADEVEA